MTTPDPLASSRRLMVLITLLITTIGLALAVKNWPDVQALPAELPPHEPIASIDGALVLEPVVQTSAMLVGLATDADGHLYAVGKQGVIYALDPVAGTLEPWLDLTDRVDATGSEQGLLGLVFAADGRFYVNYTRAGGDTHVSRFAAPIAGDEEVLLVIEQPYGNHNGGDMHFGPDGMLWIAVGDGGGAGDPQGRAQNPNELLGKMLRIDVSPDTGYAVPPDNPWADGVGGRAEIGAIGVRNPWRFWFDGDTAWIADVGQSGFEEVTAIEASALVGANLGWDIVEGHACFSTDPCDVTGLVPPTVVYGHDEGCSVTGGVVVRGDGAPSVLGAYLFSDFCGGWIRAAGEDGSARPLFETGAPVAAFGVDDVGAVYVVALDGRIWRLVEG